MKNQIEKNLQEVENDITEVKEVLNRIIYKRDVGGLVGVLAVVMSDSEIMKDIIKLSIKCAENVDS
jgi:DNA-binding protein YbaB